MPKNVLKCRFSKCSCLHSSTDVNRDEAVQGGNGYYYHPDCFAMKDMVDKTCNFFIENINRELTTKQIIQLRSVVYKLIFENHHDARYIYFCVWYVNKYQPGKLKFPGGLYYVVQRRDIETAWNKLQTKKQIEEKRESEESTQTELFENEKESFHFIQDKPVGFADILG